MTFNKIRAWCAVLMLSAIATPVVAQESLRNAVGEMLNGVSSAVGVAPTGRQIEVGFSPEGTAEPLVLKAIRSARQSIHVMAYVMSEPDIEAALARAARSHIEVVVEADYHENIEEDRTGVIHRRLDELVQSGATVCVIRAFPIFHDKVMIVDGRHVETGSYNYSVQAKLHNSENALVLWNMPELASQYEAHFRSRIPVCSLYRAGS